MTFCIAIADKSLKIKVMHDYPNIYLYTVHMYVLPIFIIREYFLNRPFHGLG